MYYCIRRMFSVTVYVINSVVCDEIYYIQKHMQYVYSEGIGINMKTLKASNFPDLSKASAKSTEVAAGDSKSQSKSTPAKKPTKGRATKKEPYERASFTLTSDHIDFLDSLVQTQLNDGLNSNQSHVLRQLLNAEIKRNSK